MEVTVKAYLQKGDDETEVRRVSMQLESGSGIFKTLEAKVAAAFPGLSGTIFSLTWQDSDEDLVTMSTDEELQEALSACASNMLKIFISDFDKSAVQEDLDFEILDDMEGTGQKKSLPEPEVYRPDHNIECPPSPEVDFSGPGCPPFMGPPPFMGSHPKMGPPPPCEPCGPYPHPGMIAGRRGRHGHGNGWMKMGRRQNRPYADSWMMQRPSGWQFAGPFAGRMSHGRYHDNKRHCEGEDGDNHGWKKALRESVPVSHRRWAKLYIHNWRKANIKNSTTTTSGSDTEKGGKKLTKEMAGVPEAYVVWLDMVLPRFHQSWENDGNRDWTFWDEGGEGEADSLVSIKMSVPVEFRKWIWWFLAKRYGKRLAPQMKCGKSWGNGNAEEHSGHNRHGKHGHWKCEGKGLSGGGKMHYMASQVPKPVRRWAKRFIMTWRVEHQLPTSKSGISDSDDDFSAQDADVPEDYGKWLHKFLGRWHMWRSLIDSTKVEPSKGGMEQFKDTVPRGFRMWVKFYLCRQFGQASPGAQGENEQYQKWVQIFKKKWLQMTMGKDVLNMTSSEGDGAFSSDSDMDDEDVNTSFKRMKLDGKGAKNVKFAKAMESDDSDSEGESRVKHIRHTYPGFPRFARSELFSWDGISINDGGDDDKDGQIPPNVYKWLCQVMTKIQWKKMKQMHKAAKKETKLARKELKSIARAQKHNNA